MRRVAAAIACLLITATAGFAQDPPAPGDDVTDVAVRVDDGADIDPKFNDPGKKTAKSVASLLGITVGEATRRLRSQQRSALLVEKLSEEFPDTFLGLRFDRGPGFKIRALFSGGDAPQGAVNSAAKAAGMKELVEVAPAAMSRKDERDLGDQLMAELRRVSRGNVHFIVDPENGVVVLGAAEEGALRDLVTVVGGSLVRDVHFDEKVKIVPTTFSIAGQAWNAQSGTYPNCTTGFSVYNSTAAAYGTTTAGHCSNNSPAEFNVYMDTVYGEAGGNRLLFQTGWEWTTNGLDIQFHTLGESDDETGPYYWNGSYSVPVASSFKTEPQPGIQLCKWGRTTGWDCGTTGNRVYDPNYGGYFYTIDHPSVSMSEGGDSGGPVVSGQTAYGWTHGQMSGGVNVFLSVQQVYAKTPLRLTVCIPGTNC